MYTVMIFKTLFLYVFIIISYRIMGKKEVGKLSIIDLIVSILIAELAAMSIESADRSILMSVVPIAVLVFVQVILSYVGIKSANFRKFVDGSPKVIINNGKLCFNEMSKLRYSLDDLISQLREQGVKSINDVNYAVLENNGKLSVFTDDNIYPMPIILDGVIDVDVVKSMGREVEWVYKILKKEKISLSNVFYAFYTKEKTYIIEKDKCI